MGPLPGRVRQLLRARRLPQDWLIIMARAVEDDPAFREVVAAAAHEEELGRLPWLWLARPDGWKDEVATMVEAGALAEARDQELRAERARVSALEEALEQARSDLDGVVAAQSGQALSVETEKRVSAGLRRELRQAQARAGELEAERAQLAGRLAEVEAQVHDLAGRLSQSEARAADREAEREEAERRAHRAEAQRTEAEAERAELAQAAQDWRRAVAAPVRRAAVAAGELAAALADAAAALDGGPPEVVPTDPAAPGAPEGSARLPAPGSVAVAVARSESVAVAGSGPAEPASARRKRRLPIPLPPAVFEDSYEAADHLVRTPGARLVVDGYNVAFTTWRDREPPAPGGAEDLPALRRRVVNSLSELALRFRRPTTVVFDGIDDQTTESVEGPARPWMRIVFSASSVESRPRHRQDRRGGPARGGPDRGDRRWSGTRAHPSPRRQRDLGRPAPRGATAPAVRRLGQGPSAARSPAGLGRVGGSARPRPGSVVSVARPGSVSGSGFRTCAVYEHVL